MCSRLKWVVLGLLAFVAGQPERCEGVLPRLRIGLRQHCPEVAFSGPAGVTIQPLRGGEVIGWLPPGETWIVRLADGGLLLADASSGTTAVPKEGVRLLPPEGGTVTIRGVQNHWDKRTDRDYRGTIEILRHTGGLTVVNLVEVETYLRGVVPSEMPASYPLAALQAQAVAARGQGLAKAGRHQAEGFDLCADQHCQVYGGATSETLRSDQAVATTSGEVMVYEGRLADTLYSATCGGHTANNEDYWTDAPPLPYLRGQPDFEPGDKVNYSFPLTEARLSDYLKYAPAVNCNQPAYSEGEKIRWWSVARREEVERSLRAEVSDFGALLDVRVGDRAASGVVRRLDVIGTRRLAKVHGGPAIRRALGDLNSASFAIQAFRDKDGTPVAFAIWGAGWGHQVGMCQVGAAGLADRGWEYRQVLSKYYPGCQLERRY